MLLVVVAILLLALIYKTVSNSYQYWKKRNVRYVRPWPLFGFMASNIFRIKSFAHVMQDLYDTFPEQRYFGCYQFLSPILLIRDQELIKTIMVKEFDTFPGHRSMIDAETDPLWGRNLLAMPGGEGWRDMRSTLSPVFTSSKMRMMFGLMKEVARQFTDHYLKTGSMISLDLQDLATRFANDVIASTAFGVTCNSLKDPENDFFLMTKELTDFRIGRILKIFGYAASPTLMKFFKFRMFGHDIYQFYRNLIKETIEIRETKNIIRPDMVHLLLEAKKGQLSREEPILDSGFAVVQESELGHTQRRKTEITDDDIIAQAVLFFFAGFETVSTAISHLAYELALNVEIQEKLREEVDAVQSSCLGEITYEALLQMKYLDMVVSETLRKWPPAVITDRRSVRPFTIESTKVWENTVNLEEGTTCIIPIFAIHRDPKNYPDPDKFVPERFSEEKKGKIKPFTYLPFGSGPRNCIGSRFALLETKTFIFYILSEFEIIPTEKTQNPLIISKKRFNLIPDNGFWVGLKPRHKKMA